MKTFNINSEVRIKLTPFGIKKIVEEYSGLFSTIDKEGYCKMQLHVIMSIFGQDMYNSILPFEPIIQIDDNKLKNV